MNFKVSWIELLDAGLNPKAFTPNIEKYLKIVVENKIKETTRNKPFPWRFAAIKYQASDESYRVNIEKVEGENPNMKPITIIGGKND